ncbi:hypothetical protein PHYPSEUDO_002593 [Phytophthora pseudosyringae]|uniref:Uncharacterized protein n=1 Tax=Phytophthora pseudosyringae TaxID=221518 RepID=A0A8T1V4C4_9STRA|nr:hypothetical protein PHYPSEUDO_002593 [Phytophthora pseudosyringae]
MLPKLTVNFQGNFRVTYTSHVNFVCLKIANCPHWNAATLIAWEDLPTNKFATFYETDTCRTGGKFFYISDVAEVNGSHTFHTPQVIRSYMVGTDNDYARRPAHTVSNCAEERSSLEDGANLLNETTSAATDERNWSCNGSAAAGVQQLLLLAPHTQLVLEEPLYQAVRHLLPERQVLDGYRVFLRPGYIRSCGGDYTFMTNVLFRSMSVGVVKEKATFTYVDNCPSDKENAVVNDTNVYLTWGSDDGSSGDGGLSSNWNDTLQ